MMEPIAGPLAVGLVAEVPARPVPGAAVPQWRG